MVHFARLLTAAALVSVSVAAPMKARTDDSSYGGGDSSYQPPQGDSSYQPPSDGSYQPPSDQSYQPPSDQSYQPPSDQSYQPPSDQSYQPPSYDSSSSYETSTMDSSSMMMESSSMMMDSSSMMMDTSSMMMDSSSTMMMDSTSTMDMESTMTTSSDYSYSTPSYGSGSQSYGDGYNNCVMQCAASYTMAPGTYMPPTQTSSDSAMSSGETGTNGVTHTIVVGPSPSVYRYLPFATNASVGDTILWQWNAGEHTVTSSSGVEVCTKDPSGSLNSGKQTQGFQYTTVVKDTKPQWFYCGVADHCKQGMYGGVNINQASPDGQYVSVSDMMSNMTGNNDMAAMWEYTKSKTQGNVYASNWGMSINMAGMDQNAQMETMKNVMFMQAIIADNPQAVDKDKGFQVSDKPLKISGDITQLLATGAAPSNASSSGAPGASGASSASPSSPTTGAASSANSPGAKSGAVSVASSSVATVFVTVVAAFLMF